MSQVIGAVCSVETDQQPLNRPGDCPQSGTYCDERLLILTKEGSQDLLKLIWGEFPQLVSQLFSQSKCLSGVLMHAVELTGDSIDQLTADVLLE